MIGSVPPTSEPVTSEPSTSLPPEAAWTSEDVDAFMYLGAGGIFLIVALLVAIFIRSGS